MSIWDNNTFFVYNNEFAYDYNANYSLGVYLITDKQSAFEFGRCSEETDRMRCSPTHPGMVLSLARKIYPDDILNDEGYARREYNAHIYLLKDNIGFGASFNIFLPENGILSASQQIFILKALAELKEFNESEYANLPGNDNGISINILTGGQTKEEYDNISVEQAVEIIKNIPLGLQESHDEKIVGTVLSEEDKAMFIEKYNGRSSDEYGVGSIGTPKK